MSPRPSQRTRRIDDRPTRPGGEQPRGSAPREPGENAFETGAVAIVKGIRAIGIDVEDGNELAHAIGDRDDDLRTRAAVARDVPGKLFDVGNDHGAPLGGRGAAHTRTKRDFETTERPLVGADAQESGPDHAIEAGPEVPESV